MDKKILNAILTRVMQLQKNGHFASFQCSNYGYDISIQAMKGGFEVGRKYDINESMMLDNSKKLLSTLIWLDEIIEEWGVKEDELQTSES